MIEMESLIDLVFLVVIFLATVSGLMSLLVRLREWQRTKARLRLNADERSSQGELVLGAWTPALAAQVPMGEADKAELHKELRAAGFYQPDAVVEYAALRTILVITPLVGTLMIALLVEDQQVLNVLLGGGLVTLLGYSLPRVYIYFRGKIRGRIIEQSLPLAIDMLSLCLSAGQNLIAALQRVTKELKGSHPVLAHELDIVRRHADLRSLPHALAQFAARVQVPEVGNLATILTQAERLGTDMGSALLEYANHLRTSLRQRADAKANKTMFWLLFPMILCLWIPAGIMLIGPAVLEFQQSRKATLEEWRAARQELQGPATPTSPGQAPAETGP